VQQNFIPQIGRSNAGQTDTHDGLDNGVAAWPNGD
jgi:hypothetical protein